MRNLFALTKREQRVVITVVVLLVGAALAKHYLDMRSEPPPARSTSTLSPTVTPRISVEDLPTAEDDEAPQEHR
jgi:hypothetical protein